MSPDEQRKLGSLLLSHDYEWPGRWTPEGDAIVCGDRTVVMREELQLIIERMRPWGVPRIGPLLHLLAACRGIVSHGTFAAGFFSHHPDPAGAIARAKAAFDDLAALPRELIGSVSAKATLAEVVFEHAPKLGQRGVESVLTVLCEGLPPSGWPIMPAYARHGNSAHHLLALHDGLARLDAEKIIHALRTGVPEPPRAAEVDLPDGGDVPALLCEMEDEEEFQGLARLVRDVMAALMLPRALPQPDHDSPGGFADIGNRGELHRLLLSELAHDDDTLAARVALGEALYLRREPAANPPSATLAVLCDSGLRMWGTPRIFGTAVALACLAKTPPGQAAHAFRADGAHAQPLALGTRAGLTAHLAALGTSLNAAAAVPPLATKLHTPKFRAAGGQLDIIVVTHPLALEDADFNAACASLRDTGIRAATVDRDGAFALHLRTPGGWQPLADARLKLDALFAAKPRREVPPQNSQLPAMLRRERCAFLLPITQKIRAWTLLHRTTSGPKHKPDTTAGIVEDGSVWLWGDMQKHGAFRLTSVRLHGEFIALMFDQDAHWLIAIGHESRGGRLHLIRRSGKAEEGESHVTELTSPIERPVRWWTHGAHLFIGTARQIHVINIATGNVVAEAMMPVGAWWLNSRCVIRMKAGKRLFMAVTFNGTQVVFEPLDLQWLERNSLHVLFKVRHGQHSETWVLDDQGRFFDLDSGALRFDTHLGPFTVIRESEDKQRYLIRDQRGQHKFIRLSPTQITPAMPRDVPDDRMPTPRAWSLRSKFTHIAAHPSGRVWLRAQRGYWVAIGLRETSHTFSLERQPDGVQPPSSAKFGEPQNVGEHGCTLAFAELGEGESAWLDSRGMLHLRAADLFIPEITVVLAESTSLPVWASNEIIVGPEYFLGDRKPRPGDAEKLDGHLRAFVARCQ